MKHSFGSDDRKEGRLESGVWSVAPNHMAEWSLPTMAYLSSQGWNRWVNEKQIECGPCSLSLQYGSYTAFLWFIVKQPGAVRGSVETWREEGREVERHTGWVALIRSRETPLPPPQLAASDSNLSCQWQLLKAAWGFGDIMFDFFQISTFFFSVVVDVLCWLCSSRWQPSTNHGE